MLVFNRAMTYAGRRVLPGDPVSDADAKAHGFRSMRERRWIVLRAEFDARRAKHAPSTAGVLEPAAAISPPVAVTEIEPSREIEHPYVEPEQERSRGKRKRGRW